MTKFVCVLRRGPLYNLRHVMALKQMVETHCHAPFEFICLSDDPLVPGWRPLQHNWPGWWSKIEIFTLDGPVFYMDLDTVILGDITEMIAAAAQHPFVALRDPTSRGTYNPFVIGSGLMMWNRSQRQFYDEFCRDPAGYMQKHKQGGDQQYLENKTAPKDITHFQTLFPDTLFSYKFHVQGRSIPPGAKIIVFHGPPKPWMQSEVPYVK